MAIQSSFYTGTALDGRTFPSSKHIATKAHMAIWKQRVSDNVWVQTDIDEYQLINNSCVLNTVVAVATYDQMEIRVADAPDELADNPTDIALVAGVYDDVSIVADIASNVTTVANDLAAVQTNSTNIVKIVEVANNKANIDTVATDIANVNTVADNISHVAAAGSNIGSIVALEANYDEIKTVSEQANFGLFNAINLSANVIGVDATIATGQNGVSFGDMTIAEGVAVTIEDGSSWAIL